MKKKGVLHKINDDLKLVMGYPAWEWLDVGGGQWALERYLEAIDNLNS